MDKVNAAGCGGRHPRKTSVFLGVTCVDCIRRLPEAGAVMDDFFHGQLGVAGIMRSAGAPVHAAW